MIIKKISLEIFSKIFFCFSLLIIVFFFIKSQFIGGFTIDEVSSYHFINFFSQNIIGYREKLLEFAQFDYYRIINSYGSLLPITSHIISIIIKKIFINANFSLEIIHHYVLHTITFIFYVISIFIFRNFLKLLSVEKYLIYIFVVIYSFNPLILGHSFFNYKDIPFLLFYLSFAYYFVKLCSMEKKISKVDLVKLTISFAGASVVRPSSIPIFLCFIFFFLIYKKMPFKTILFNFSIYILIFITFTPQFIFAPDIWINDLIQISKHHQWAGCTMTNDQCIGKNYEINNWNIIEYLTRWFSAKIPFSINVIFILSLFLIFYKSSKKNLLLVIFFLTPLIFIIFNDVNIYNGLRQILFLIPILYLVCFNFISVLTKNINFKFKEYLIINISAILIILKLIDNINLLPYNYAYLNYPTRISINTNYIQKDKIFPLKYELDYWGFSLKELLNKSEKNELIENFYIKFPLYWDPIIIPFTNKFKKKLSESNEYNFVSTIYGNQDVNEQKFNCELTENVNRTYLIGNKKFYFSFLEKCN